MVIFYGVIYNCLPESSIDKDSKKRKHSKINERDDTTNLLAISVPQNILYES